tara:strand:- start:1295 stop:2389 length:1095 start_codon:yes stop_codon:yes gene_type:complete
MANRLQIYRNLTTNSAPTALEGGELAYTLEENTLYVGSVDDSNNVNVLSDGDTVSLDSDSSILVLKGSTGSGTVTLKVPTTIANNIELKFPSTIEQDKLIQGSTTGQLEFDDITLENLSDITDIESSSINNNDILKWDEGANEWKHISPDDFKALLGLTGGSTTHTDMIVNGNLIVQGETNLDTGDVVVKDKTLVLGVSGGVLEGTVTSATPGGDLIIVGTNGVNDTTINDLLWVDGDSITSGIYQVTNVNSNTITFSYPSGTIQDDTNSDNFVLFSADPVSDDTVDGSGFRLIGESNKTFQWNKSAGVDVNPYFDLDGGNLYIDGSSLWMEGIKVIDIEDNTLNEAIEVTTSQISADLDGGVY